jgi:hypothetical protein
MTLLHENEDYEFSVKNVTFHSESLLSFSRYLSVARKVSLERNKVIKVYPVVTYFCYFTNIKLAATHLLRCLPKSNISVVNTHYPLLRRCYCNIFISWTYMVLELICFNSPAAKFGRVSAMLNKGSLWTVKEWLSERKTWGFFNLTVRFLMTYRSWREQRLTQGFRKHRLHLICNFCLVLELTAFAKKINCKVTILCYYSIKSNSLYDKCLHSKNIWKLSDIKRSAKWWHYHKRDAMRTLNLIFIQKVYTE